MHEDCGDCPEVEERYSEEQWADILTAQHDLEDFDEAVCDSGGVDYPGYDDCPW